MRGGRTVRDGDPVVDLGTVLNRLDGRVHLVGPLALGRLDDLALLVVGRVVRSSALQETSTLGLGRVDGLLRWSLRSVGVAVGVRVGGGRGGGRSGAGLAKEVALRLGASRGGGGGRSLGGFGLGLGSRGEKLLFLGRRGVAVAVVRTAEEGRHCRTPRRVVSTALEGTSAYC